MNGSQAAVDKTELDDAEINFNKADPSLFTMDELEEYVDDVEYWAYPFLQKKGVLIIGAEPKSFKTYFALQLVMAISTGSEFLGWKTNKARVLYIDQEIGPPAFRQRYLPMKKIFGKPNLILRTKGKKDILLDPDAHGRNRLEVLIKEQRPDIIVFDSLRKTTTFDESSSTDMANVFRSLTHLQETYGFAAIIVHHAGKPSENRRSNTPTALRGSGEIFAHADSVAMITRPDGVNTHIDVSWTFRNHEDIDDFKLELSNGLLQRRKAREATTTGKAIKLRLVDPSEDLPEAAEEAL